MGRKQKKRLEITRRRCQVAELHLQGWSQEAIGQHLGVSQATISSDIRAIAEKWEAEAERDKARMMEIEVRKQHQIEKNAWRGYEESFKPIETTRVIQDATGKRAEKIVRQQSGDPRYLEQVRRCSADRRAILGLDSGSHSGPPGKVGEAASEKDIMAQIMSEVESGQSETRPTDAERIEQAISEDEGKQSNDGSSQDDVA